MNKIPTLLSSNYVTAAMVGRLGNQMFQIANVYAQSLRHNRQPVLPRCDTSVADHFTNVFRKLEFLIDRAPSAGPTIHTITGTYHYSVEVPHPTKPTVFRGYYESEKFFKDFSENIRWLYGPPSEFVEKALIDYPQLKDSKITAINVRRGDFLTFPKRHPVITANYIHQAINLLPPTDYYFVVSDDISWCKENIKLPHCIFVSYTRHEALWLLSLCDHYLISNSTFSWWGAWLGTAPDKVVIAPSVWFGPDITVDTKDIYCEGWKIMPAKYHEQGTINPA